MHKSFDKLEMHHAQIYMADFNRYYIKNKNTQRVGQMAYNTLNEYHDASILLGDHCDPFYCDANLSAFIDAVFDADCAPMMHKFFAKYRN